MTKKQAAKARNRKQLTICEQQDIADDYKAGWSISDLQRKYRREFRTIKRAIAEYGVPFRAQRMKPIKPKPTLDEQIEATNKALDECNKCVVETETGIVSVSEQDVVRTAVEALQRALDPFPISFISLEVDTGEVVVERSSRSYFKL